MALYMSINRSIYNLRCMPSESKLTICKIQRIKSTSLIKASNLIGMRNSSKFRIRKNPNISINNKSSHQFSDVEKNSKCKYHKKDTLTSLKLRISIPKHVKTNSTIILAHEASSNSSSDTEVNTEYFSIEQNAQPFVNLLIKAFIDDSLGSIVRECINDMISASLILFSSSILDIYLKEVLNEIIPSAATQAYKEIIDHNYIEYLEELTEN